MEMDWNWGCGLIYMGRDKWIEGIKVEVGK